ncbi:aminopeptidase [Halobacteriales archaeon QH_10_67_22]|nr:MAG: aminopeptidase [Halobacteriales archaeon QH_10_67_22]
MDEVEDATARALGRAWLDETPWTLLTRLTELDGRLGGHPGERRAATLVADTLQRAGVRDVTEQSFEMNRWDRHGADLAVTVPDRGVERSFEAVALPYSPAVETDAPLVDVGHATPAELDRADVAGAVVVADTATPAGFDRPYHRDEKAARAAAAGAEGFVFVNHVPGQLPPTGSLGFGAEAPLPGLGVSKETGAWLREYADEGGRARVRIDAETEPGTSHNVVGTLGPDDPDGDGEVVVLAHFDAHDVGEGALDNGCGVATLAGIVAILADLPLQRRVRVAAVGSEELGLLGSRALADRLVPTAVHAVVNVDGAGRYRDLNALTHGSDALAELVERVVGEVGHPVDTETRPHPYSDHWPFLQAGVPALQLHSDDPNADGPWDRGWTHTRADTRDKTDRRNLRTHAMLGALLVRAVAATDLPRVETAGLRERLEATGAAEGMRVSGIWPDEWD